MKLREVVFEIVKDSIKLQVGAEIGVWYGGTTRYLLDHYENLKMISVDPYQILKEYLKFEKITVCPDNRAYDSLYEKVRKSLECYGNRSILKRTTSSEASKTVENGSLDFVFIDADHQYKYVKEDIDLWLPKIRKGGIILGHDYYLKKADIFGVQLAVKEKFETYHVDTREPLGCWYAYV